MYEHEHSFVNEEVVNEKLCAVRLSTDETMGGRESITQSILSLRHSALICLPKINLLAKEENVENVECMRKMRETQLTAKL